MGALTTEPRVVTERFPVRGMTCGSCVEHVHAAIAAVPGVSAVHVDLADGTTTVRYDPAVGSPGALRRAVAGAGYLLEDAPHVVRSWPPVRPFAIGVLAAAGLVAFYLGIITLAQGWGHAVQQLYEDRWFIGAIVSGFGTQMGLFTYLRDLRTRMSTGGVAASTGTSTTAMLACCAHHLSDILPILGLSGAAIFLDTYKTPLLWLGIAMNLIGIVYLLRQVQQQRRPAVLPASTHH